MSKTSDINASKEPPKEPPESPPIKFESSFAGRIRRGPGEPFLSRLRNPREANNQYTGDEEHGSLSAMRTSVCSDSDAVEDDESDEAMGSSQEEDLDGFEGGDGPFKDISDELDDSDSDDAFDAFDNANDWVIVSNEGSNIGLSQVRRPEPRKTPDYWSSLPLVGETIAIAKTFKDKCVQQWERVNRM